MPENPIGWYLTQAAVVTLIWWPYSLYWWRRGIRRTKERIVGLLDEQRAQEAKRIRAILGPGRVLLWLMPVGIILLVVMSRGPADGDISIWDQIATSLLWLIGIDLYFRGRFMVRALEAPRPLGAEPAEPYKHPRGRLGRFIHMPLPFWARAGRLPFFRWLIRDICAH